MVALMIAATLLQPVPQLTQFGMTASWYGYEWDGRITANGEVFDHTQMTAAHRTLPFQTLLRVSNPATDASVIVRINDRGPFDPEALERGELQPHPTRELDLSQAAFAALASLEKGVLSFDVAIVRYGEAGPRCYANMGGI